MKEDLMNIEIKNNKIAKIKIGKITIENSQVCLPCRVLAKDFNRFIKSQCHDINEIDIPRSQILEYANKENTSISLINSRCLCIETKIYKIYVDLKIARENNY